MGQFALAMGQEQLVRVGLFDNQPMCYREAGKPAGIFVVVLEYVAAQEGWQLEYVDGTWAELRQKLRKGEIDILPSMALSDDRQNVYAFNNLDVFTNWGEIYAHPNSKIHTLPDLQGKRVAAMDQAIYTTGPEGIIKLNEVFGLQSDIILVPDYVDALRAVQQGQADAAVVNRLVGALYSNEMGLQKTGIIFAPVRIRFGLTKESKKTPDFLAAIDSHFQVLHDDMGSPYQRALAQVFEAESKNFQLPSWLPYVFLGIFGIILILVFFVFTLQRQVVRKTRDALDSEGRFLNIAENCLDWVWEFDEQAKFTYASRRVKDLLGYTPEEILGKSAFDLIPSPEKEKVAEEFKILQDNRQSFALLQNVNQHKDGSLVILESSGVPIIDPDGRFRGYRGIDRDVSERKALEERMRQAQKMEAIGTLAGGIAHDFNNILTAIFGYVELAKLELASQGDVAGDLDHVLGAARRAKELVKQILTFSRQNPQEKELVIISTIIKEALKLLRASLPTTIDIQQEISSSAMIFADFTEIHQVIMNLCTNAYHAMEETGGVLTIQLYDKTFGKGAVVGGVKLTAGNYVVLRVSDTGKGIAMEHLGKIFDPYFTTKDKGRGTGLGLAVVHGAVGNHHGAIEVNSQLGLGTHFTIYLPVFEVANRDIVRPEDDKELPAGHEERILVVDDEKDIRDVVHLILSKAGYRVEMSANGQEALDVLAAQNGQYDLLLTDMSMPGMSGKELAAKVIALYPQLPILICTGYSSQLNVTQAKEIGIHGYLEKPLTRPELLKQVQQTLDRR